MAVVHDTEHACVLDTLPRLRDRLAMLGEEARPTILTFHGETGKDAIPPHNFKLAIGDTMRSVGTCPAPTQRHHERRPGRGTTPDPAVICP
jgi:hypothetical protein